ncbi:MAG: hypothetical protein Q9163_000376 [Psora crenata]
MPPSLLAKSAQGATFLILLQVASRALTFIGNQILLRYLSPQILGVAIQLELFSVSTLYFSRESIRVALQRQRSDEKEGQEEERRPREEKSNILDEQSSSSVQPDQRIQEAINLSCVAIGLGVSLTIAFQCLYIRSADGAVLSTPYLHPSLNLYALATILELLHEPLFAIVQQQMLYGTRASAEMQAAFTRCIITCLTAIGASRSGFNIGVLPFAVGQLSYAVVLVLGYLYRLYPLYQRKTVSLLPTRTFGAAGKLPLLPSALVKLACTLYGQALFKQLLTSGDAYLIAALTALPSQGAYALASNYGGLLARVLFQPIEESSRSLFARLILPPNHVHDDHHHHPPTTTAPPPPRGASLKQAKTYLTTTLRLYALLSLLLTTIAPPLTGPLLHILAGPRWTATEAPAVLSAYCCYLPLLAINGLLEAYVSAVATPTQLRTQSVWMVGFSLLFGVAGWVVLRVYDMGARGLVVVNAIVMGGRIAWSWWFVAGDLSRRPGGVELVYGDMLPTGGSLAVGIAARAVLELVMEPGSSMGLRDLAGVAIVVGVSGLAIVFFERAFLVRCYHMLRPPPSAVSRADGDILKKKK